jgi:hypothetical protein
VGPIKKASMDLDAFLIELAKLYFEIGETFWLEDRLAQLIP